MDIIIELCAANELGQQRGEQPILPQGMRLEKDPTEEVVPTINPNRPMSVSHR